MARRADGRVRPDLPTRRSAIIRLPRNDELIKNLTIEYSSTRIIYLGAIMAIKFDQTTGIIDIQPSGPLTCETFQELGRLLQQNTSVKGFLIESKKFPGWANFQAFKDHMKFIKDNQSKIKKIALVSDSPLAFLGENVMGLFLAPRIKRFPFDQSAAARIWIQEQV
jgi:hypothetical protein